MKKTLKWFCIVIGGLIVLIILAVLIIPMFVDLQEYKPRIENMVSDATGRPFSIGGDIDLSLFPWVGFSTSDIHMGNPAGYKEKDLASVKSIDVSVRLIPLLSKDIQVKRFIVEGPRIVIEKGKDGRTNLDGLGKSSMEAAPETPVEKEKTPAVKPEAGLPITGLVVGEFSIRDGSLLMIDHGTGNQKEVSAINFELRDVSLENPIQLALSAVIDGLPLKVSGNIGPVGKEPGKGDLPVDFRVMALEKLEMALKGKITDPATNLSFDLSLGLSQFSPRNLFKSLGQEFPIETADPNVLNRVAFKADIKGNPKDVSVSDGLLELDESNLRFSARAKDFSRPDLTFDLQLDKIDLDSYLAPVTEKKSNGEKEKPATTETQKKIDYSPLRKPILDGTLKIGELKARGASIQDIMMKISAKNGVFNLDPLSLNLYQGHVSSKGSLDVRQDSPLSKLAVQAQGIQVNPLIKDFLKKDFLEGTVKATLDILMEGDDPEKIKKTLNGKGDFLFNDGAIIGIDLGGMVQNIKAKFGLAESSADRPRTDFSELHAPLTIKNGLVDTRNTTLQSPLLRVQTTGMANLVDESLDFRVEPKFVGTLKGQGDSKERAGITVPVLVSGTFSAPKFKPDLEGMLKGTLEKGIADPSALKEMLPGKTSEESKPALPSGEEAKDLLKGLFGR